MNKHFLKAALAALLSLSAPAQATQMINAGPSLSVIQGDRARFSAQFFDRDGNIGVSIRAEPPFTRTEHRQATVTKFSSVLWR